MSSPTLRSVLTCLTKSRLLEVAGLLDVGLARNAAKDDQIEALAASRPDSLAAVLAFLLRDELKAICRAHSLDDGGRARAEIAERILSAVASPKARRAPLSEGPSVAPPKAPASARAPTDPTLPCAGDIAVVRHRQYFVEAVSPPASHGDHTLVSLVCLDDDAQGRRLDVLWELELGARVFANRLFRDLPISAGGDAGGGVGPRQGGGGFVCGAGGAYAGYPTGPYHHVQLC